MEIKKTIEQYFETKDEQLAMIRNVEKLMRGEERNILAAPGFLNTKEQAVLQKMLPQISFVGGTEGCERKIAVFIPEYLTTDDAVNEYICCLRASFYEENALNHRQILGTLMGSGLKRECIGDICIEEKSFDVFVVTEMCQYLIDNIDKAGRTALKIRQIPLSEAAAPVKKTKNIRVTVSSLRLDVIIAAAFHLSRGEAAYLIHSGEVTVESLTCDKPDRLVTEQTVISVRHHGKFILYEIVGETKKGKTAVMLGIYV